MRRCYRIPTMHDNRSGSFSANRHRRRPSCTGTSTGASPPPERGRRGAGPSLVMTVPGRSVAHPAAPPSTRSWSRLGTSRGSPARTPIRPTRPRPCTCPAACRLRVRPRSGWLPARARHDIPAPSEDRRPALTFGRKPPARIRWSACPRARRAPVPESPPGPPDRRVHFRYFAFRNSSGEILACLRTARIVPSGMSPGWLGIVV